MDENYICKFCGKICKNANSLRNHERLCKENPNRDIKSLQKLHENTAKWNANHTAWNKGLTRETDERVKQYTDSRHARYLNGELSELAYKHVMSEATKKKISEKQKENYRGISRYATAREGRKSYAEQYFDKIFTECERNYHVDRFFLDYAWPEKKVYVEVDGEQHYTEAGLAHDDERTLILEKLGWRCIERIRWSEYQKLDESERKNYLETIFTKLL